MGQKLGLSLISPWSWATQELAPASHSRPGLPSGPQNRPSLTLFRSWGSGTAPTCIPGAWTDSQRGEFCLDLCTPPPHTPTCLVPTAGFLWQLHPPPPAPTAPRDTELN